LQDPEVAAAFQDISAHPENIGKYKDNPKVQNLMKKMMSQFGGPADESSDSTPSFGGPSFDSSSKPAPHVPPQPDID